MTTYLTLKEAAEFLRISDRHLRNLMKLHGLPVAHLEGRRIIKRSDLEAWVDERTSRKTA